MNTFKTLLAGLSMVLFSAVSSFGQTQIGNNLIGCSNCKVAFDVTMADNGEKMTIGNPGVSDNLGAVEHFDITASSLTFTGPIFGTVAEEEFGTSLSLSADGNVIAISGPGTSGNGVVRVYDNTGSWVLDQELPTPTDGFTFGHSVSLSDDGTRLAVGDPDYTNDSNEPSLDGATFLYENQDGTWNQIGTTIGAEGADNTTKSGWSVALSGNGNRLVIGDYLSNTEGLVRVFEWANDDWQQLGDGINGMAGMENHTGWAVDINLDGSRIVVGSPQFDGAGANSGRAKIYEWNGTSWVQVGGDLLGLGEDDFFGGAVTINDAGNRVAIGAPSYNGGMGYTVIYDENSNSWSEVATITGLVDGDLEGSSVSLDADGDRIVIGAPGNNLGSIDGGMARVFEMVMVSTGEVEVVEVTTYPNPTNGLVRFGDTRPENIQVLDAFGREVLFIPGLQYEIDLTGLPAGIYILRAEQEGEILQARIFKK